MRKTDGPETGENERINEVTGEESNNRKVTFNI